MFVTPLTSVVPSFGGNEKPVTETLLRRGGRFEVIGDSSLYVGVAHLQHAVAIILLQMYDEVLTLSLGLSRSDILESNKYLKHIGWRGRIISRFKPIIGHHRYVAKIEYGPIFDFTFLSRFALTI